MKISEILVEQELDEISRRGFLKGAVGAAATGLGMSSAKDSKAQSMDSPPENMIVNDIPLNFVPGDDPRSIPPEEAIQYMPPIIVGWPAPFWWINRWWYPPLRQQFLQWSPYYWQGNPQFSGGYGQGNYRGPVQRYNEPIHNHRPVHVQRPSAPPPQRPVHVQRPSAPPPQRRK